MHKDDVFVFWSVDQTPFEMLPENNLARREVATACRNGAYFIYMYPSAELLKDLKEKSGLHEMQSAASLEGAFDDFKEDLSTTLAKTFQEEDGRELNRGPSGKNQEAAEGIVSEHVVRLRASGPAFASPNHRFVVFVPAGGRARGFARFPTGTGSRPNDLQLSLHARATGQFLAFVKKSLRDILEEAGKMTEVNKRRIFDDPRKRDF